MGLFSQVWIIFPKVLLEPQEELSCILLWLKAEHIASWSPWYAETIAAGMYLDNSVGSLLNPWPNQTVQHQQITPTPRFFGALFLDWKLCLVCILL